LPLAKSHVYDFTLFSGITAVRMPGARPSFWDRG